MSEIYLDPRIKELMQICLKAGKESFNIDKETEREWKQRAKNKAIEIQDYINGLRGVT